MTERTYVQDGSIAHDFPAQDDYDCSDVARYDAVAACIGCGQFIRPQGHAADCPGIPPQAWPDICPYCADGDHDGCCFASVVGDCWCGCGKRRRMEARWDLEGNDVGVRS